MFKALIFMVSIIKTFIVSFFIRITNVLPLSNNVFEQTPETALDTYLRIKKEAFLKIFIETKEGNTDNGDNSDKTTTKYNTNITPIFYDRLEFSRKITESKTTLDIEFQWKARILYEYTPIGGITMYYDVFKDGFAYYCDSVSLSQYAILNAVAMKYVTIFRCRDFFIDDSVTPYPSVLASAAMDELRVENNKKREVINNMTKNKITTLTTNTPSPFVKFRTYNKNTGLVPQMTAQPVFVKNRFIYMGKTADLKILQNPRVKRVPQKLSYKDFKLKTDLTFSKCQIDTWADSAP